MISYHKQYCHKQQTVGINWRMNFAYVEWLHYVSCSLSDKSVLIEVGASSFLCTDIL